LARKTLLQLLNDLEVRLRAPTSSGIPTTGYGALLVNLINHAKRDIEDAWEWTDLRTTLAITTAASTSTYSLTDFADRYRIQRVWNDTGNREIRAGSHVAFERRANTQTVPSGTPTEWRISPGLDSNNDPQIEFYPTPSAVETVNVIATVPQAELSMATDVMTIPHWPVLLRAYALAISERGEVGGTTAQEAQRDAEMAAQDAIAHDNLNHVAAWSTDWHTP